MSIKIDGREYEPYTEDSRPEVGTRIICVLRDLPFAEGEIGTVVRQDGDNLPYVTVGDTKDLAYINQWAPYEPQLKVGDRCKIVSMGYAAPGFSTGDEVIVTRLNEGTDTVFAGPEGADPDMHHFGEEGVLAFYPKELEKIESVEQAEWRDLDDEQRLARLRHRANDHAQRVCAGPR